MATFSAGSVNLRGRFTVSAALEDVFELFSPLGEKLWVPGWNPELLHPPGVSWERGLIFRTQGELGEAVWVVTLLDRERHDVEYCRIEPGRYVARVRVRCESPVLQHTEVVVTYTFIGLSDAGNREIADMSEAEYEQKMRRWQGWIGDYLSAH